MSKFLAILIFRAAALNPDKRVSDALSILACDRPHSARFPGPAYLSGVGRLAERGAVRC
jgi:hypothetical protein